jgi:hypothetical protein
LGKDDTPAILIRKIEKTVLEMESIVSLDDVYLFALGIASFLCPL